AGAAAAVLVGVAVAAVALFLNGRDRHPKTNTGTETNSGQPIKIPAVSPKVGTLVPDGNEPVKDGDRQLWRKLRLQVPDLPEPVEFVLVEKDAPTDPDRAGLSNKVDSFYVMRNKVSAQFYGRFAADQPDKAGTAWKKGGLAGEDEGNGEFTNNKDPNQ